MNEAQEPLGHQPDSSTMTPAITSTDDDTPLLRFWWARWALIAVGTICVALGVLGAFLPVLPTTPFLLLAAACYARSSRRFYERLLSSPGFGPLIREYRATGAIPTRAKAMAVTMIAVTIGLSVAFVIPLWPVKLLVAAIGVSVSTWILTRPTPGGGSER